MNSEKHSLSLNEEDEKIAEEIVNLILAYERNMHPPFINELTLIGDELNKCGYPERIRKIYDRAVELGANDSTIQYAWENIGDWRRG